MDHTPLTLDGDAVKEGVSNGVYDYIAGHPYSAMSDPIEYAVKVAVSQWLDAHHAEILTAIVEAYG